PVISSGQHDAFRYLWARNVPVVVHDVRLQGDWTPEAFVRSHGQVEVFMIDSARVQPVRTTVAHFFSIFQSALSHSHVRTTHIVKQDWPPSADFCREFSTHYRAFMDAVPFPVYTRQDGCFNLVSRWPINRSPPLEMLKPDLGPKMYVATTDRYEDGSTRLHLDVTSAVNILAYTETGPETMSEDSGALWHIFPVEETTRLREYLRSKLKYAVDDSEDPIHAQGTYLTKAMRAELHVLGVHFYEIVQQVGQAVFIPAGCAHQVSNLRPCIKVACDFVCLEGLLASMTIVEEFRREKKENILQLEAMMWHAWTSVHRDLQLPTSVATSPIITKRQLLRSEHVARRRREKGILLNGPPGLPLDYTCPLPPCDKSPRKYLLDGLFNHMYVLIVEPAHTT
ncbi:hypothetical protein C8Q76DRAFT_617899, partial [Earliella scabrosa]